MILPSIIEAPQNLPKNQQPNITQIQYFPDNLANPVCSISFLTLHALSSMSSKSRYRTVFKYHNHLLP